MAESPRETILRLRDERDQWHARCRMKHEENQRLREAIERHRDADPWRSDRYAAGPWDRELWGALNTEKGDD